MTPTPSVSKEIPLRRHIDASTAGDARPKPKTRRSTNPSDDSHVPPQRRTVAFRYRAAVHEAGHAVTRLYLRLGTLERISIEGPQGGGVSWRMDELDDQTEDLLTAAIVSALAGRAAEEEIVGSVAVGSGGPSFSDLAYATDIAFQMEATLGLGARWPLLHRPTKDQAILFALDPELATHVNARLENAYTAARRIVARQRDVVECLAALLLGHRTLEGAALKRILAELEKRMSL